MASPSSSSTLATRNALAESYIGSYISLISKYEIRYEGILHQLNVHDSTIALKDVRSYGTEGRKKDGPQIPSSDKVYEFILFRGSDIKDLQVKTTPPVSKEEPLHDDPAIIQSHYSGVALSSSASASIDHEPFAESARRQDVLALTSGAYSPSLSSVQSANHVDSTYISWATENPAQSFSMPVNWQGYNRSYAPQTSVPSWPATVAAPSLLMQNQIQSPRLEGSPIMGLVGASEFVTPALSAASNLSHANFSTVPPVQYSVSQEIPPSYLSLQSHAAYNSIDRLTNTSFPYSNETTGLTNVQSCNQDISDPMHSYGVITHCLPQRLAADSSPLHMPIPSLLNPDELAQSTSHVISSLVCSDQKKIDLLAPLKSAVPSSMSTSATQAPLLPLPSPGKKEHKQSTIPFTEEFDFEAMNEKFKKDEVWGYLGKKSTDQKVGTFDESFEDRVPPDLVTNFDPKPAYKKNEFFDTISCTSLSQGRNVQNRFSERMKQDTETFGWSNQSPNMGYGGYGTVRGNYYRGRYNWGRGRYGYGGRHNGNLPF